MAKTSSVEKNNRRRKLTARDAAKRKALFEEHPPAYVLPLTWRPDFMGGERGGAPTMEVHWTVWRRGHVDTKYRLLGRGV